MLRTCPPFICGRHGLLAFSHLSHGTLLTVSDVSMCMFLVTLTLCFAALVALVVGQSSSHLGHSGTLLLSVSPLHSDARSAGNCIHAHHLVRFVPGGEWFFLHLNGLQFCLHSSQGLLINSLGCYWHPHPSVVPIQVDVLSISIPDHCIGLALQFCIIALLVHI